MQSETITVSYQWLWSAGTVLLAIGGTWATVKFQYRLLEQRQEAMDARLSVLELEQKQSQVTANQIAGALAQLESIDSRIGRIEKNFDSWMFGHKP